MTTRQILLSLMLTIAAGCGAPTPEDATVEQATSTGGTTVATGTTTVTVTAQTLAALPPAQHYLIDPTRTNIVYRFHPTFGPIDFSRVGIRGSDGSEHSLVELNASAKAQGIDLTSVAGHVFTMQPNLAASSGGGGNPIIKICFTVCIPFINQCYTICVSCCFLQ